MFWILKVETKPTTGWTGRIRFNPVSHFSMGATWDPYVVPAGSPGRALAHIDLGYTSSCAMHSVYTHCLHTEPLCALTGRSTVTSEPSSSRTRQVMVVLAAPAAGMWTDAPPVTTAGACTTCCWWARSRGFPLTAPPPPPSPPPLPSRSSLSLVWKRLRERRLNVRRRKPIIFPIHEARRSVPRPWKLLHTTAGVLLLLPPPPPRGEESLSRHGGDFRAADQSSGWMSAAAERLRPHTNETNTDRATSGPPTIQSGVDDRTLSRKHTNPFPPPPPPPPPVLSSPVHLPPALLGSLLRTDSKILEKSRPTLRSGSPWVTRGRRGGRRGWKEVWSPLDRHRTPAACCRLFPPGEAKVVLPHR